MKISIDTRTIKPGEYFIPIKGPNHDGRQFIEEAINKGAKILDVDLLPYAKKYRKKLNCRVIAVTGSAGKTTIKDLLFAVLSEKYKVVKTLENQNNEIGVPLSILRADYDSEILILELGMRNKGEIAELTQIVRPTDVVITNIGVTHIEILKTQKRIAEAKAEVFRKQLNWEKSPRYAFINFSTPYYQVLQKKAEKNGYRVLPYTGQDKPDQNINLCYTLGQHFGLTHDQIGEGLKKYKNSEHRLAITKTKEITVIDDAYNANPDGVQFALQYLKRFNGRKILVLGEMRELGDRSEEEHVNIIQYALDANIAIIFTFGEKASVIKSNDITVYNFLDKKALHKSLLSEIKSGDIILIKGSRSTKMEETVDIVQKSLK
jgi:UDP-N-acetylmuramoyl-tripeptide--D-alanyl-D-alanine ligase